MHILFSANTFGTYIVYEWRRLLHQRLSYFRYRFPDASQENALNKISNKHAVSSSGSPLSVIRNVRFAVQAVYSPGNPSCTNAFIDNIEVTRVSDHLTNIIYVVYAVGVILAILNAFHVLHLLGLDDTLGVDLSWLADPACECNWFSGLGQNKKPRQKTKVNVVQNLAFNDFNDRDVNGGNVPTESGDKAYGALADTSREESIDAVIVLQPAANGEVNFATFDDDDDNNTDDVYEAFADAGEEENRDAVIVIQPAAHGEESFDTFADVADEADIKAGNRLTPTDSYDDNDNTNSTDGVYEAFADASEERKENKDAVIVNQPSANEEEPIDSFYADAVGKAGIATGEGGASNGSHDDADDVYEAFADASEERKENKDAVIVNQPTEEELFDGFADASEEANTATDVGLPIGGGQHEQRSAIHPENTGNVAEVDKISIHEAFGGFESSEGAQNDAVDMAEDEQGRHKNLLTPSKAEPQDIDGFSVSDIGRAIIVKGKGSGVIRFVGLNAMGLPRVGIEYNKPKGKHNGTVNGLQYFVCDASKGILTTAENVKFND